MTNENIIKLKKKLIKDLEKEKEFIDWSVKLGRKAKKRRLEVFGIIKGAEPFEEEKEEHEEFWK